MASKSAFYAVVAGVGAGTGRSLALKFAKTYPVVLLARRPESYADLVKEIQSSGGQAIGISTDTADPKSVSSAFESIKSQPELANLKLAAAVYNVGAGFSVKPFLELTADELDSSLASNARGLFNFAQNSLPLLLESVPDSPNPPSLLVTGATASLKGSARFSTFAAGKFAKRAIAQSLAREFGPKGVHVAHIIIDGIIDTPRSRSFSSNAAPDAIINPDSIADTYWHLHTQHRSAFSQEVDLRPYVEKF